MDDILSINRFYLVMEPGTTEVRHVFSKWVEFKKHLFPRGADKLGAKPLDVMIIDTSRRRNGVKVLIEPPHITVRKQAFFDF